MNRYLDKLSDYLFYFDPDIEEYVHVRHVPLSEGFIKFVDNLLLSAHCALTNDADYVVSCSSNIFDLLEDYLHKVNLISSGYFQFRNWIYAYKNKELTNVNHEFIINSPIFLSEVENQDMLLTFLQTDPLSESTIEYLRQVSLDMGVNLSERGLKLNTEMEF